MLGECDLTEKSNAKAKTLSGGQKRKLQLAISFVGGSKVCCIDEASSGLDPLSRRNIWNIIQTGRSRRTILVTTHFLDEADVLADHIAILYKSKLVCEGPGTSLKSRFGGEYIVRSDPTEDDDPMIWRTPNSAQATRKVLELEAVTGDTFDVVFPTLEQVFLKVTSDSIYETERNGDGEEDIVSEKILGPDGSNAQDVDLHLDISRSIGVPRQVFTLFRKRYTLLLHKSGWLSYGVNLIIPIIIAAVLAKFLPDFPSLQTCATNFEIMRSSTLAAGSEFAPLDPYNSDGFYSYGSEPVALLGPRSAFTGPAQDQLYIQGMSPYISMSGTATSAGAIDKQVLDSRGFKGDPDGIVSTITNSSRSFSGFGIWSPTPDNAVLFYDVPEYTSDNYVQAFSLITNRLANASTTRGTARLSSANIRTFTYPESNVHFMSLPIAVLIGLAFIASASIAVIYPAFEKINRVRALHYCNGVSPFALWLGYLLFDMQFIIIQSIVVWAAAFSGSLSRLYFESSYIFGVFILFGIATYLGTYLVSLFVKKAAFAIAAGLHILLYVLYLVGYVVNQSAGDPENQHRTYSLLQYLLGLTSPGANLARALFVSMNAFDVLCGKYGDDESPPFSYHRYGSVYANLLIQIAFLISMLVIYEYGSADWFRRNVLRRGAPARLHYTVDSGQTRASVDEQEKNGRTTGRGQSKLLDVSKVSKSFGRVFATENISFDISSKETLALLGGNGAGKTTMINLIRGELKPDFGNIELNGISVLRYPHKARIHMGVCPQDDAVDNLTVRQTLNFYASVKGLKNVSGNVDKVLNALKITSYERLRVKALSGGTKRKLSVAIALLGNPRVLLLDEPSTGQDAGAKRILWKMLQDISADRAILLTTHSMEEAEALATDVAIMGTRMLATGTLGSLQEEHGGLYSVRAVRTPEASGEVVERMVNRFFGGQVVNYADRHGQVSFNLPHDKKALGRILKTMEALKGDVIEEGGSDNSAGGSSQARAASGVRVLQEYTVNGPTLEEVFMNVARERTTTTGGGV